MIKKQPVIMFALEWCEFCGSVIKFFNVLEIPFQSIDLDSVEYQKDDKGLKIRKVLEDRTGQKTIPQIYIGKHYIGGGTDLFDAWKSGKLKKILEEENIPYNKSIEVDPYTMLPTWMHPR